MKMLTSFLSVQKQFSVYILIGVYKTGHNTSQLLWQLSMGVVILYAQLLYWYALTCLCGGCGEYQSCDYVH